MGMGPIVWTCLALTIHQAPAGEYFMPGRSFRIPIQLDPKKAGDITSLNLLVSRDKGKVWEQVDRRSPNESEFLYRALEDGSYWFIVQHEDRSGQVSPRNPERVKPNMAVIVDATRPQIKVTAERLPNGDILAHWTAADQYPDMRSLRLEYSAGLRPGGEWTPAGLPGALVGEQRFSCKDPSGEVRVRLRMKDKAGNPGEDVFVLPAAATSSVGTAGGAAESSAISLIPTMRSDSMNRSNQLASRQTPRPLIEAPGNIPPPTIGAVGSIRDPEPSRGGNAAPQLSEPAPSASGGMPIAISPVGPPTRPTPSGASEASIPPPTLPGGVGGQGNRLSQDGMSEAAAYAPALKIVRGREVRIDFTVGKVGPSGLGNADVYVTLDRGRSWKKMPQEVVITPAPGGDGRGPVVSGSVSVQLPKEAIVYGFIVAAKSKAGRGPLPPKPNDPPQALVEWDKTPPNGALFSPQPDPSQPNTLVLGWEVKDRNLTEKPITLEWAERTEGPWNVIGGGPLPNSGQYPWRLPEQLPPRVYLRMTMRDLAGNESRAQSEKPQLIDLSVPQTRITGIAPTSR